MRGLRGCGGTNFSDWIGNFPYDSGAFRQVSAAQINRKAIRRETEREFYLERVQTI